MASNNVKHSFNTGSVGLVQIVTKSFSDWIAFHTSVALKVIGSGPEQTTFGAALFGYKKWRHAATQK